MASARSGGLVVLGALLACGGIDEAARADHRAMCASQPGFDQAASDDAMVKLRGGACRTKLFFVDCEDWWEHVVTTCVHRTDTGRRIDVHTDIQLDTAETRRLRSELCDHVRWDVSKSDPAYVYSRRGRKQMTTCGKVSRPPH